MCPSISTQLADTWWNLYLFQADTICKKQRLQFPTGSRYSLAYNLCLTLYHQNSALRLTFRAFRYTFYDCSKRCCAAPRFTTKLSSAKLLRANTLTCWKFAQIAHSNKNSSNGLNAALLKKFFVVDNIFCYFVFTIKFIFSAWALLFFQFSFHSCVCRVRLLCFRLFALTFFPQQR